MVMPESLCAPESWKRLFLPRRRGHSQGRGGPVGEAASRRWQEPAAVTCPSCTARGRSRHGQDSAAIPGNTQSLHGRRGGELKFQEKIAHDGRRMWRQSQETQTLRGRRGGKLKFQEKNITRGSQDVATIPGNKIFTSHEGHD